MKVYIFESNAPDVFFALAEDGMILATCGSAGVQETINKYRCGFDVEVVADPVAHAGVQHALGNNKLRARFAGSDAQQHARAELFRWQYGDLPRVGDTRAVNVRAAAKSMVVGITQGEATWEGIALVMNYMLSMLPEQEEVSLD